MKRDREEAPEENPRLLLSQPRWSAHFSGLQYSGYDFSDYVVPTPQRDSIEFVFCLDIKPDSVGRVMEENSEDLLKVQETSGVRFYLHSSAESDLFQTLEVIGTRQQVMEAVESVEKCIQRDGDGIVAEKALICAQVPSEMLGYVIGKSGKNIKTIKENTKAGIRIDTMGERTQSQSVRITGSIDEVLNAFQKVCESLRSFDPRRARVVRENSEVKSEPSRPSQFGGSPVKGPTSSYLQSSFIIQTPTPLSLDQADVPAVLVLRTDGSYVPAPVVFQPLPLPASRDSGSHTSRASTIETTSVVPSLDGHLAS